MSKPRTPEYFPRMKDRAGRRRARRSATQWQPTILGRFLNELGRTAARIVDNFVYAMRGLPTRAQDYALNPAPRPHRSGTDNTTHDAEKGNSARRSTA